MGILSMLGPAVGAAGGVSHPSGSSDPWFQQWFPPTGGVTGQPNVDPGQLKPVDPGGMTFDPSKASPTTGINGGGASSAPSPYGPIDYSQVPGGYDPNWAKKPYDPNNPRDWGVIPNGPVDWTDPNRRDYSPTNPIWPGQTTDPNVPGYLDPNRPPSYLMPGEPGYGAPRQNPFNKPTGGFMGGILGAMGPFGGNTKPGGFGGLIQRALAQIRTPGGRVLSVPAEHLQEALARGAQHIGGMNG